LLPSVGESQAPPRCASRSMPREPAGSAATARRDLRPLVRCRCAYAARKRFDPAVLLIALASLLIRRGSVSGDSVRAILTSFVAAAQAAGSAQERALALRERRAHRHLRSAVRNAAAAIVVRRLRKVRGAAPRCGVRLLGPPSMPVTPSPEP
jgi:hypothetical protein